MTAQRTQSRLATVLLAIGVVLLLASIGSGLVKYRMYHVLSDSMTETLMPGDRILSDGSFSGGDGIRRGDVVMLDKDAWPDEPEHSDIVKRVVALGGDTVSYTEREGKLEINGTAVDEDYLAGGVPPAYEDFSVEVADDQVFVLGDNRLTSVDSRANREQERGPVPASAIKGRVVGIVFPFGHAGSTGATASFEEFDRPRGSETTLLLIVGAALAGVLFLLASGAESLRFRLATQQRT